MSDYLQDAESMIANINATVHKDTLTKAWRDVCIFIACVSATTEKDAASGLKVDEIKKRVYDAYPG